MPKLIPIKQSMQTQEFVRTVRI